MATNQVSSNYEKSGQEEIAPGMLIEWFNEGQIVAYTMNDTEVSAVDTLFERAVQIMNDWSSDRPYLAMYQVGDNRVLITPYIRKKLSELNENRPELAGRAAAVLPDGPAGHAVRLFFMTRGKRGKRHKKYFQDRNAALQWLRDGLPQK